MRHRGAHRANRIPAKYILGYDPAANERCNVEALSVNRRKSCDIGQMTIDGRELGEPIRTAV
jgi:hypothetical protein